MAELLDDFSQPFGDKYEGCYLNDAYMLTIASERLTCPSPTSHDFFIRVKSSYLQFSPVQSVSWMLVSSGSTGIKHEGMLRSIGHVDDETLNCYTCSIAAFNKEYRIFKHVGGVGTIMASNNVGTSIANGDILRCEITADHTINFYRNDVLQISWTDPDPYLSGQPGLHVVRNTSNIVLDDFHAKDLDSGTVVTFYCDSEAKVSNAIQEVADSLLIASNEVSELSDTRIILSNFFSNTADIETSVKSLISIGCDTETSVSSQIQSICDTEVQVLSENTVSFSFDTLVKVSNIVAGSADTSSRVSSEMLTLADCKAAVGSLISQSAETQIIAGRSVSAHCETVLTAISDLLFKFDSGVSVTNIVSAECDTLITVRGNFIIISSNAFVIPPLDAKYTVEPSDNTYTVSPIDAKYTIRN